MPVMIVVWIFLNMENSIGVEKIEISGKEYYQCYSPGGLKDDFKRTVGDIFSSWLDIESEKIKLKNQIKK